MRRAERGWGERWMRGIFMVCLFVWFSLKDRWRVCILSGSFFTDHDDQ